MFRPFRDWSILRKILTLTLGSVVFFLAGVFFWLIPFLEERMVSQRARASRELVQVAVAEIRRAHEDALSGKTDESAAQRRALSAVTALRFGDNGYFWIHDYDNRMLAHPTQPGTVGRDFSRVADANGVLYIPRMTETAKAGGGVVEYLWPLPGNQVPVEKISYASAYPPWRWVVGTGVYVEDVRHEFNSLRKQLAFIALALGVAALAISLATTHRLTRPIKDLLGAAGRVAEGDLEVRVATEGSDELGELCAAFNAMTGDLNLMVERIRAAQRERDNLTLQLSHSQKLESIGRLAGGVAHDFNNMLGVIIGYVEMLKAQVGHQNPIYDDLEEIHKAACRSAAITSQLLAFARRQSTVPQIVDLNHAAQDLLKMIAKLAGENVRVIFTPGEELWPVVIDPSQFNQIFTNLAANARDAMKGEGRLEIATENATIGPEFVQRHPGALAGEFVKFTVTDTGCGIDPREIEKIFDPFYTTKEVGEGTGLGLSTVHGIARQNGGFVTVASVPGRGASFAVHLPKASPAKEGLAPSQPLSTQEFPAEGRTVLIVEDEPGMLKLGERILTRLGYRVLAAPDPAGALELVTDGSLQIDLLLTDVVMPGMNGWELSKAVRSLRPGIKCLYMSGYSQGVMEQRGIDTTGFNCIRKPFSAMELRVRVSEALSEPTHWG